MVERLKYALIRLGAGLVAGLMAWAFVGVFMLEGGWPYFLWTMGSFIAAGTLIGMFLPRKAGEYFTQFLMGILEGGHL